MDLKKTRYCVPHSSDEDGIALHDPHAEPLGLDVAADADGVPLHLPEADPLTIDEE